MFIPLNAAHKVQVEQYGNAVAELKAAVADLFNGKHIPLENLRSAYGRFARVARATKDGIVAALEKQIASFVTYQSTNDHLWAQGGDQAVHRAVHQLHEDWKGFFDQWGPVHGRSLPGNQGQDAVNAVQMDFFKLSTDLSRSARASLELAVTTAKEKAKTSNRKAPRQVRPSHEPNSPEERQELLERAQACFAGREAVEILLSSPTSMACRWARELIEAEEELRPPEAHREALREMVGRYFREFAGRAFGVSSPSHGPGIPRDVLVRAAVVLERKLPFDASSDGFRLEFLRRIVEGPQFPGISDEVRGEARIRYEARQMEAFGPQSRRQAGAEVEKLLASQPSPPVVPHEPAQRPEGSTAANDPEVPVKAGEPRPVGRPLKGRKEICGSLKLALEKWRWLVSLSRYTDGPLHSGQRGRQLVVSEDVLHRWFGPAQDQWNQGRADHGAANAKPPITEETSGTSAKPGLALSPEAELPGMSVKRRRKDRGRRKKPRPS